VNAGHFLQPTTKAIGHRVISFPLYSAFGAATRFDAF